MTEKEIHEHLAEIIGTMNDGLFLVSPEGRIVMVNEALMRITGYGRAELEGQTCSILGGDVCERSRAEGGEKWCGLFHDEREHRKSCHIMRKDGVPVPCLKNSSILKNADGRVLGAVETLTDISEISIRDRRIEELSRLCSLPGGAMGMVGDSPAMARVFDMIAKAAASAAPVIIHGESGTGKELAARAIHDLGPRASGPFVQVNCAALSDSLLESELFGHVRGAFTGAYRHRKGRLEEAQGGDIFLDEIGDTPLGIQVKLLRVLETKSFERVGDNRPVDMDARLITATNQDLAERVANGAFRKDFFYRINVIPIHLPPLRERREDIPALAAHFIKALRASSGKDITGLAPEAMRLMAAHPWPGNVRELKSALEYAFVVCEAGLIAPEHLPADVAAPAKALATGPGAEPGQKQELIQALRATGGNKTKAAALLGVTRVTVLNRMRKYGVDLRKVITE